MSLFAVSRIISASLGIDHKFRFRNDDARIRRHGPRQPYITANDGAATDYGRAPKYRGSRIDDDVIFNGRMTLFAANHPAFLVHREAQRAECDTLIQFDAVADV